MSERRAVADDGARSLTRAIDAAGAAGRLALAPFLTAGFPDRDGFAELLSRVEAACDVIEIGVPFSDPMADGVTIQASSRAALAAGVTTSWILDTLDAVPAGAPRVLMSYLNPLLSFGLERLAARARGAGVCGVIVPDLPYEESAPLRELLEGVDAGLVQLVTPVTPEDRLRLLCEASRGFVYAVTKTGTTGGAVDDSGDRFDYLRRVRAASSLPVLAGFGIRDPQQLAALDGYADGAIVGSALIEVLERGEDPLQFLDRLRQGAASRRTR